jgi:hypothetical protein
MQDAIVILYILVFVLGSNLLRAGKAHNQLLQMHVDLTNEVRRLKEKLDKKTTSS